MMHSGKTKPAERMLETLWRRYSFPEWAFFPALGDAAGYYAGGRADAIAMNLYPSRGLEIHGFELKASRSDWLRELNNPEKAERFVRLCDRWWVCINDKRIVEPGELPPRWGLMLVTSRCRMLVQAEKLELLALDRLFVAAMLKKAYRLTADLENEALQERWRAGYEAGKEDAAGRIQRLEGAIADFESASGIKFNDWQGGKIGEAVKIVLDRGHLHAMPKIRRLRNEAARVTQELSDLLTSMEEVQPDG